MPVEEVKDEQAPKKNKPVPVKKEDQPVQESLGTKEQVGIVPEEIQGTDHDLTAPAEELIPVSKVEEIIARTLASQGEEHKRQMEELRREIAIKSQTPTELKRGQKTDYMKELIDDVLEKPAVFFSYRNEYFLYSDFRENREVICPGGIEGENGKMKPGRIAFKTIIRQRRRTENGDRLICVSSAKIESKSQYEFLKKHSRFGIDFFESLSDVNGEYDPMWAQKIQDAANSIAKMRDIDIISECTRRGIPLGQDVQQMRKRLIDTIARSYVDAGSMNQKRLESQIVDQEHGTERVLLKPNMAIL